MRIETSRSAGRLAPLEAIRGFAAVYVLACHICNVYLHNPPWALPLRFGAEVVVLFFLLSGFVVQLSTPDGTSARSFMLKRMQRIYPLFVCSLAFSYLLSCWSAGEWMPPYWHNLLGNLLMLQDFGAGRPGVWFDQYFNEALWSLSYEWWFYIAFIVLLRNVNSPSTRNLLAIGVGAAAMLLHSVVPNQLGYYAVNFLIWWSAACAARQYMKSGHINPTHMAAWALVLLLFALAWLPFYLDTPIQARSPGLYPVIDARRFVAAAAFLCLGMLWHRWWHPHGQWLFSWTLAPFRKLASVSYGIYIFHFPIIVLFANSPLQDKPVLCVAAMLVSTLLVAYVAEHPLQRWINRWSVWSSRAPSLAPA